MGTEAYDFIGGDGTLAHRLSIGIDACEKPDRLKEFKAESLLGEFMT
jgi:hypothetical protein